MNSEQNNLYWLTIFCVFLLSIVACDKGEPIITIPEVSINAIEQVTINSAQVSGQVTTTGGGTITAQGFVIDSSPNPTVENATVLSVDVSRNAFQAEITDLNPNSDYYIRTYATSVAGTAYSEELAFKTLQHFGLIENLTLSDEEITYVPISKPDFEEVDSDKGFVFEPTTDIEITAVGGLMRATGSYRIRIIELSFDSRIKNSVTNELLEPYLVDEMVEISDVNAFTYIALESPLTLNGGQRYLISYIDQTSRESVYELILPRTYLNPQTQLLHPMEVEDIIIESSFRSIHWEEGSLASGISSWSFINHVTIFLTGIPDFKYKVPN